MHNQNGVCLGIVTSEQVHQLVSVLSATPLNEKLSKISGSTICLPDGTASHPKPQPHFIPQSSSKIPPSGTTNLSHFISVTMKNGFTFIHDTWIIYTGVSVTFVLTWTCFKTLNPLRIPLWLFLMVHVFMLLFLAWSFFLQNWLFLMFFTFHNLNSTFLVLVHLLR